MRKKPLVTGLMTIAGLLAAGGAASADMITNGNFESGNTGFTSGYTADSSAQAGLNAGPNAGAGYYGIVTDSQFWHPYFTDFGDHTTGSSNMMIVNATNVPDVTVWSEGGISVTPGNTYQFSFWATSAYPVSPATLHVTTADSSLDQTVTLSSTAGQWQQFSMDFTPTGSFTTLSLVDTNLELSGNDFALDDLSLSPVTAGPFTSSVPLPASSFAGLSLCSLLFIKRLRNRARSA